MEQQFRTSRPLDTKDNFLFIVTFKKSSFVTIVWPHKSKSLCYGDREYLITKWITCSYEKSCLFHDTREVWRKYRQVAARFFVWIARHNFCKLSKVSQLNRIHLYSSVLYLTFWTFRKSDAVYWMTRTPPKFRVPTFSLSWNSLTFPVFLSFFPDFFSKDSKMQIIFIYDFRWGYYFKLKLHGDNWNILKCYVCPQYVLIMNMFFIMWN